MGKITLDLESNAKQVINDWNTLNKTGEELNETTKEFGDVSSSSFKEASDSSDQFGKTASKAQIKTQVETKKTISLSQRLTGSFNNFLGTVGGRFGPQLQRGFAAAQKGLAGLTGGFKLLKVAIASTGIGLLLIAVGSLFAFFTRAQGGIETFRVTLKQVTAVIDVIVDRFSILGSAITKVFSGDFSGALDDASSSLKGLGDEIQREIKIVADLERQLISLEKQETNFVLERAKNERIIAEARLIAEDDSKSIDDRIDGLEKAQKAESENLQEEIRIARERVAIKLAQASDTEAAQKKIDEVIANGAESLKLSDIGVSESNQEDKDEIIKEISDIVALESASFKLRKRILAERQTLEVENNAKLKAIRNKNIADQKKESARVIKIQDDLNKRLDALAKKAIKAELANLEGEELFNKVKENEEAEIQLLEDTLIEKGRLLDEEFELNEDQLDQLDSLRKESERKRLAAILKFNSDKKAAEIKSSKESLDIQQEFAEQAVSDLEFDEADGLTEVDFEIFKEEQKLIVQQEFAQKRIDLTKQEIAEKKKLFESDGELTLEEENQLKRLELQERGLEATVVQLQKGIDDLNAERGKTSMAEILGLTEEEFDNIKGQLSQITDTVVGSLSDLFNEQQAANDARIEQAEEDIESKESELDREIELNRLGFASNVEGKRRELQQLEEEKKKAQEAAEVTAKKQFILDTAIQASSIATASANIIKGFSTIPFGLGTVLGIANIALMVGSFIAARTSAFQQIKAGQVSLAKGGAGDDTGMITGNRHSQGGERFTDQIEVESGENWGVLSRDASKKHGSFFVDMTNALNRGLNPDQYMDSLLYGTGVSLGKNVDKRMKRRNLSIQQQEVVMLASETNKNMENSLLNIDGNFDKFMKNDKEKLRIFNVPGGRIEVRGNKKTFIKSS